MVFNVFADIYHFDLGNNTILQPVPIKTSDIYVYYGEIPVDSASKLMVDMNVTEFITFPGLRLEVNVVECNNLSLKNFIVNNDSNMTAT